MLGWWLSVCLIVKFYRLNSYCHLCFDLLPINFLSFLWLYCSNLSLLWLFWIFFLFGFKSNWRAFCLFRLLFNCWLRFWDIFSWLRKLLLGWLFWLYLICLHGLIDKQFVEGDCNDLVEYLVGECFLLFGGSNYNLVDYLISKCVLPFLLHWFRLLFRDIDIDLNNLLDA